MQLEPRKAEVLDPGREGAVDDVVLDGKVFVDKIGAVGIVGVDAADPGCGEKDVVGLLLL